MLTIELGYKATSEQTGIKAATLRQWAKRFHWHNQQTTLAKRSIAAVTSVTPPGDILLSELARHERSTKLSLARAQSNMAQQAESAKLHDAPNMHAVTRAAALLHKWEQPVASGNVMVNIALLGIDPEHIGTSEKPINATVVENDH